MATSKSSKESPKQKPCVYCKSGIEEPELVKRGSLNFHKACLEKYYEDTEAVKIKARDRTCPRCKEKVNPLSTEAVDTNANTFHKECYETMQRSIQNREALFDYICMQYKIEFVTGFMLKQIDKYHKQGMSYRAMLTTLKYIFEIEKIPVKENAGLGLIPYCYEKAKQHYAKVRVAGDSANNITINNKVTKIQISNKQQNKKTGYIDMNEL